MQQSGQPFTSSTLIRYTKPIKSRRIPLTIATIPSGVPFLKIMLTTPATIKPVPILLNTSTTNLLLSFIVKFYGSETPYL